jgi:hypothetical protein
MTKECNQQPERWERAYSKLFWVLFACGVAFAVYLDLKDWVIGLEQARERGALGAVLLRTGVRSLPLVALIGLSFYLRRFRSLVDRVLSRGRIFLFIYDFVILFSAAAATGFLNRSFWSWYFLLVMPLGFAGAHAIFAEQPSTASSDSASQPQH